MIAVSKINFNGSELYRQDKRKKNYTIPLSIGALGLGVGGGYGTFKLGKHTKCFNEVCKISESYMDELLTAQINKFNYNFINELSASEKYLLKISKDNNLFNKKMMGNLKAEDFLDDIDLLTYKKNLEELKKINKETLSDSLKKNSLKLKQTRNKYLAIGSAIGATIGALLLIENSINKNKPEDKKSNIVTPLAIMSAIGASTGQIFHLIKEKDFAKIMKKMQNTYATTLEKGTKKFEQIYATSIKDDLPWFNKNLEPYFEGKSSLEDTLSADAKQTYREKLHEFKKDKYIKQEKDTLDTFKTYLEKGNKRMSIGCAIGCAVGLITIITSKVLKNKHTSKNKETV